MASGGGPRSGTPLCRKVPVWFRFAWSSAPAHRNPSGREIAADGRPFLGWAIAPTAKARFCCCVVCFKTLLTFTIVGFKCLPR